jgi:hypothetical protein
MNRSITIYLSEAEEKEKKSFLKKNWKKIVGGASGIAAVLLAKNVGAAILKKSLEERNQRRLEKGPIERRLFPEREKDPQKDFKQKFGDEAIERGAIRLPNGEPAYFI